LKVKTTIEEDKDDYLHLLYKTQVGEVQRDKNKKVKKHLLLHLTWTGNITRRYSMLPLTATINDRIKLQSVSDFYKQLSKKS